MRGLKLAVVSASENCREILRRVGLLDQFDAIVSGTEAAEFGLAGKPAPDTFLAAAELLAVAPADAADPRRCDLRRPSGTSGGNFGLVIGVDRGTGADLGRAGAGLRLLRPLHPPVRNRELCGLACEPGQVNIARGACA